MIPGLTFLEPWVLTILAVLPLLWRFLRVTPPAPKRILFPAIFLLRGLNSTENTPAAMPPWLIILRLIAVMMLILGLAHPIFDTNRTDQSKPPVLIMLFDNSWSSGRNWQQHMDAAHHALDQAERDQQKIILITTADNTRDNPTQQSTTLLAVNDARARLDSLSPQPWQKDPQALEAILSSPRLSDIAAPPARILWLHSGISSNADPIITNRLEQLGNLEIILPTAKDAAIIVPAKEPATGNNRPGNRPEKNAQKDPQGSIIAHVIAAEPASTDRFTVAAIDGSGRRVAEVQTVIPAGQTRGKAVFTLPHPLAQRIVTLRIEGQNTAAGVLLLDDRWKRRIVALIGQPERQQRPLIDEHYYLERALSFKHDVIRQPLDQSITSPATTIILTDQFQPTTAQSETLIDWVQKGGLLIRFSGPRLSREKPSPLLPVRPRQGERTLGGALSWDQPIALSSFDPNGPFGSLTPPDDVLIRRQILAEPTASDSKIWARLADGTPLVTARRLGQGWTVLFHITAGANWSDLPLSGVFVDMLNQLTGLSGGSDLVDTNHPLPPWRSLDGWGQLTPPPATALPFDPATNTINQPDLPIGPTHPPGYYGDQTMRQAVNLGPFVAPLAPARSFPEGIKIHEHPIGESTASSSYDLKTTLLSLAFILLCLDTLITLYLRGFLTPFPWSGIGQIRPAIRIWREKRRLSRMLCILIVSIGGQAEAQSAKLVTGDVSSSQEAVASALSMRLAFIKTGVSDIDRLSHDGLKGLSTIINQRSTVRLSEPVGVSPDSDDLSFFPLIYWPVTDPFPDLSPQAIDALNRFMELGGTLVFDAMDGPGNTAFSNPRPAALRILADALKLPPLVPVPANHVLNRSFYLIDQAPGRWTEGNTWIQEGTGNTHDSISPVIIGSADWASAWALDKNGDPLYPLSPGGKRQREHAYRFGVNLVMYILTGNYKSDQVHIPAILERLGQ